MKILYPCNPLNSKEADEPYQEEYNQLKLAGINCSLFDFDTLDFNEFNPIPRFESKDVILYRGWMLNIKSYKNLVRQIEKKNATVVTSVEDYEMCHHLIGWYEQCKEFTAETYFFDNDENLKENIQALGWDSFFIKDYVKSNSTKKGSIASSPNEAIEIVELIKKYRGEIEGGVAVRRVEDYIKNTEIRYFVMNGKAYSPNNQIPEIVEKVSKIINAPFYSIDVIQRNDGKYRIVEIGDGQVSDKKSWDLSSFVGMLAENS